jgi:hypothetical protein
MAARGREGFQRSAAVSKTNRRSVEASADVIANGCGWSLTQPRSVTEETKT